MFNLCLLGFGFVFAEGAWERPGLPGLLSCFSWGPWSQRKDQDATTSRDPAQSKCFSRLVPNG
jgi:hypothetical protein